MKSSSYLLPYRGLPVELLHEIVSGIETTKGIISAGCATRRLRRLAISQSTHWLFACVGVDVTGALDVNEIKLFLQRVEHCLAYEVQMRVVWTLTERACELVTTQPVLQSARDALSDALSRGRVIEINFDIAHSMWGAWMKDMLSRRMPFLQDLTLFFGHDSPTSPAICLEPGIFGDYAPQLRNVTLLGAVFPVNTTIPAFARTSTLNLNDVDLSGLDGLLASFPQLVDVRFVPEVLELTPYLAEQIALDSAMRAPLFGPTVRTITFEQEDENLDDWSDTRCLLYAMNNMRHVETLVLSFRQSSDDIGPALACCQAVFGDGGYKNIDFDSDGGFLAIRIQPIAEGPTIELRIIDATPEGLKDNMLLLASMALTTKSLNVHCSMLGAARSLVARCIGGTLKSIRVDVSYEDVDHMSSTEPSPMAPTPSSSTSMLVDIHGETCRDGVDASGRVSDLSSPATKHCDILLQICSWLDPVRIPVAYVAYVAQRIGLLDYPRGATSVDFTLNDVTLF